MGRNHARRRRGYGTRGKRVVLTDVLGNAPNGTLIAACDCNGFIKAVCEWIVGTVDSDRFVHCVENSLCPDHRILFLVFLIFLLNVSIRGL